MLAFDTILFQIVADESCTQAASRGPNRLPSTFGKLSVPLVCNLAIKIQAVELSKFVSSGSWAWQDVLQVVYLL